LVSRILSEIPSAVTSTSNTLVSRILSDVTSSSNILVNLIKSSSSSTSSQWTTLNNNIYYNTANVGIGIINPINKLHLYDNINNATKLTIQNNYNYGITSSGAPISEIIGNYKYMIFTYTTDTVPGSGQTQYDINIIGSDTGLICDILMVGGGGAGGSDTGGGGGGGAVLYGTNINIPLGTSTIYVGRGALLGEVNGKSTEGFDATILGGGSATNSAFDRTSVLPNKANSGGGGAGGKVYNINNNFTNQIGGSSNLSSLGKLTGAILYHGYNGETAQNDYYKYQSGSGGGAGGPGYSYENGIAGSGGDGVLVNILGEDYYWGGGGGGGDYYLCKLALYTK